MEVGGVLAQSTKTMKCSASKEVRRAVKCRVMYIYIEVVNRINSKGVDMNRLTYIKHQNSKFFPGDVYIILF